jgi:hypothetical protein
MLFPAGPAASASAGRWLLPGWAARWYWAMTGPVYIAGAAAFAGGAGCPITPCGPWPLAAARLA